MNTTINPYIQSAVQVGCSPSTALIKKVFCLKSDDLNALRNRIIFQPNDPKNVQSLVDRAKDLGKSSAPLLAGFCMFVSFMELAIRVTIFVLSTLLIFGVAVKKCRNGQTQSIAGVAKQLAIYSMPLAREKELKIFGLADRWNLDPNKIENTYFVEEVLKVCERSNPTLDPTALTIQEAETLILKDRNIPPENVQNHSVLEYIYLGDLLKFNLEKIAHQIELTMLLNLFKKEGFDPKLCTDKPSIKLKFPFLANQMKYTYLEIQLMLAKCNKYGIDPQTLQTREALVQATANINIKKRELIAKKWGLNLEDDADREKYDTLIKYCKKNPEDTEYEEALMHYLKTEFKLSEDFVEKIMKYCSNNNKDPFDKKNVEDHFLRLHEIDAETLGFIKTQLKMNPLLVICLFEKWKLNIKDADDRRKFQEAVNKYEEAVKSGGNSVVQLTDIKTLNVLHYIDLFKLSYSEENCYFIQKVIDICENNNFALPTKYVGFLERFLADKWDVDQNASAPIQKIISKYPGAPHYTSLRSIELASKQCEEIEGIGFCLKLSEEAFLEEVKSNSIKKTGNKAYIYSPNTNLGTSPEDVAANAKKSLKQYFDPNTNTLINPILVLECDDKNFKALQRDAYRKSHLCSTLTAEENPKNKTEVSITEICNKNMHGILTLKKLDNNSGGILELRGMYISHNLQNDEISITNSVYPRLVPGVIFIDPDSDQLSKVQNLIHTHNSKARKIQEQISQIYEKDQGGKIMNKILYENNLPHDTEIKTNEGQTVKAVQKLGYCPLRTSENEDGTKIKEKYIFITNTNEVKVLELTKRKR